MTNSRFSLEIMQDYAFKRGGELLSKEYANSTTDYIWRCKNGHKWKARAIDVIGKKNQKGSWCPHCPKERTTMLNLDDLD